LAAGHSIRAIADALGRSPSTVSREVNANGGPTRYRAARADRQAWARATRPKACKLAENPALRAIVEDKLQRRWSPQQIAGWLKVTYPKDPQMQVSHESIYRTLYVQSRGALRRELTAYLRTGRVIRRPKGVRLPDGRGGRPNTLHISERPAEAEDRAVPGHWEGDLIKGEKNRSEVGVLLERQSRRVVLARLTDARAVTVREAFEAAFRMTPPALLKTLTYDQGSEMAEHATLATNANINIYFADAHSPWQKGAIENANGLLRQYLPKGTNLANHTQAQLNVIAEKLNNRPRECLNWKTPNEVWAELVKKTLH